MLSFNVYAFIDELGVPYYIGQTLYFEERCKEHNRKVKNNLQLKYVRARELLVKGVPFVIQLLHKNVSKDLANVLEIYYMRKFPNLTNNYEKKLTTKSIKHGKIYTQVYRTWANIHSRCYNTKNPYFAIYGGRGITVQDSWNDFNTFYKDMGDPPSPKHSIDRIDNSVGYFPGNCRWATSSEQARNTRRNHVLTYKGKNQCLMDWAEELDISYTLLRKRLRDGWAVEDAFETPVGEHRLYVTHNNETKTLVEWANILKINERTLRDRIFKYGWSTERSFKAPKKKSDNIILTYNNETKSLPEWANLFGLNRNTLTRRISRGMPLEEALNKKVSKPMQYQVNGKNMTLKEWGKYLGVSDKTLRDRIHKLKWTLEKALNRGEQND